MSLSTLPGVPSSLAVSIGRESSNDGALASIRALLARGDSSRLASRESETPLAWAARSGDYTTVGRLLSAGVDPNGGRPLHAASLAVQHAIKTSRRLLGGGSDPEALDAHGRSAADVALAVGNQRLCEILVAAGAPLACGDPSDAAIANWEQAAQQPAFLALVRLLSSLCVRAPRLFRDRLRGFRGQGVVRLDFDLHAVAEYLGVDPAERRARPEDRESLCNAWLDELADEVRGRGFQLVRNVHLALDEPYSLLLFPTSDPFSILYAHDVDGRGLARVNGRPRLLDARGIIAELRELSALAPFDLLECGRDAIGGRFSAPFTSPAIPRLLAGTLGDLAPNLLDLEAAGDLESARDKLAHEIAQTGEFFLWWG